MEEIPHLDLYNFSEPSACDSPYVLTSPRSLQVFFLQLFSLLFLWLLLLSLTVQQRLASPDQGIDPLLFLIIPRSPKTCSQNIATFKPFPS